MAEHFQAVGAILAFMVFGARRVHEEQAARMHGDRRHQVVSLMYEAALDEARWPDVLVALAGAMECKQSNLEIFDSSADAVKRIAPLCDPAYERSFRETWRAKGISQVGRTSRVPVGQVYTYGDVINREWFLSTAFYHDWWRPQGADGDSMIANLFCDHAATTLVTVHAPNGRGFSTNDRRSFAGVVQHFIRAITIQRRLRLARIRPATSAIPNGFVVVDQNGWVLDGDEATLARLSGLGVLGLYMGKPRIESRDLRIESLIRSAASLPVGGEADLLAADGATVRVTVTPCTEHDKTATRHIAIDRPAALLSIIAPGEQRQTLMNRMVKMHGLTCAEAAVAVEIARGDGRAAVAARLGIRETTVRSHLTAIFDKLGIHRQAELTRLVVGS